MASRNAAAVLFLLVVLVGAVGGLMGSGRGTFGVLWLGVAFVVAIGGGLLLARSRG